MEKKKTHKRRREEVQPAMLGLDQQLPWDSFPFHLASQRSSGQAVAVACETVYRPGAGGGLGSNTPCNMPVGVHATSPHRTGTWLRGDALRR